MDNTIATIAANAAVALFLYSLLTHALNIPKLKTHIVLKDYLQFFDAEA